LALPSDPGPEFIGFQGKPNTSEIYLLQSRYDGDRKESVVELVDLRNFEIIHHWNPDLDLINKAIVETPNIDQQFLDEQTGNYADYRAMIWHPMLLENGHLLYGNRSLQKISKCGDLIWQNVDDVVHHSIEKDADGNFWAPVQMSPLTGKAEIFWTTFDQEEAEKNFSLFVQLVLTRYEKNRYLSKNNQNIHRIGNLSRLFPSAQILIPYRTPLLHAYSILKQHIRFCHLQKNDNFIRDYMYWTAHSEFGLDYVPLKPSKIYHDYHSLNHWLEQWELVYEDLINNYSSLENVKFINYERLCGSPQYWECLAKFVGISASKPTTFVMSKAKVTEDYDHSLLSRAVSIYKEISKSNT